MANLKKVICLLCALLLLFATLAGCGQATADLSNPNIEIVQMADRQTTTDPRNQNTEADEIVDYTIVNYADYIATALEDLYQIADVVIVGTFGETVQTYVCEHSVPVTQVMFHVESTNKGTVSQRSIIVEYYGGTVSMSSYLDTLTADQIAKRGLDRPDVDISNMTVTYETTKESVVVDRSGTYMLFLSYDAARDTYFILCDAYGACKMEDGLVYSLREEKYVQADFE